MSRCERDDLIHEALYIVSGMQSLLCGSRDEVTVKSNDLYAMLDCIRERLKTATS